MSDKRCGCFSCESARFFEGRSRFDGETRTGIAIALDHEIRVLRAEAAALAARNRRLQGALRSAAAELENHIRTDRGYTNPAVLNALDRARAALAEEGEPDAR